MKKFLIALCLMIGFTGIAAAQTGRKKAPAAVKMEKVKPNNEATSASKPVKKDGTPDKRFSVNKETTGPAKKDGTPDMRFKKNKKKKG